MSSPAPGMYPIECPLRSNIGAHNFRFRRRHQDVSADVRIRDLFARKRIIASVHGNDGAQFPFTNFFGRSDGKCRDRFCARCFQLCRQGRWFNLPTLRRFQANVSVDCAGRSAQTHRNRFRFVVAENKNRIRQICENGRRDDKIIAHFASDRIDGAIFRIEHES